MFRDQLRRVAQAAARLTPPAVPSAPRGRRGPWSPPDPAGPYKLPKAIEERLVVALRDYRNRESSLALAVFLARFWSMPARLVSAFPVDRRALADHPVLGLTEAMVRGAITTLLAVGFLEADPVRGSAYRATEAGLHRKPVQFRFGAGYRGTFAKANGRSQAARGQTTPSRRPIASPATTARPVILRVEVAQKESSLDRGLIMGDQELQSKDASTLEFALTKLGDAVFGRTRG